MAENYENQFGKGINELIAVLEERKSWPYPEDESEIQEIIESLITSAPIDEPIRKTVSPVTPEEEKEGFFSKVKNWFKPKRKSAVEREEKTKPSKINITIITQKQGERTPKNRFIQGDIIEVNAIVTQGEKTVKDFKIIWKIEDLTIGKKVNLIKKGDVYNEGHSAQGLIYTDSLNYINKKPKKLRIYLLIYGAENNDFIDKKIEECTVIPNPVATPTTITPPSPEEPEEEPTPEEEKEGFFSKVKNWFKPKRKSAVEEELETKESKKTPRMHINLAGEEVKQTEEAISLNIFNARNEIVSAENSSIITLYPDINSNFTAITTPANLVEQRKLKYKWILVNEEKKVIELKTTTKRINYAFLYGKITEGIWNLRCELIEPYFIFKNKLILSAICNIIKPKTTEDEEVTQPKGTPAENEEPPSPESTKLNPQIIRIYHGKELPKKKKGKK